MISDVILYSYRRPEMTEAAIQRIVNWNPGVRVHVSIDGLRSTADSQEEVWRNETIHRSEKLAESSPNIIPHVWQVNNGLTDHAIRIFDQVFETTGSVMSLEEDNLVTNEGFNFLANSTASQKAPGIATAYTSQRHRETSATSCYTLFPEQWGTALNIPIYEKFREVWFSKRIERHVTAAMLSEHFKCAGIYEKIVVEKWHRMFMASANDKSYGDALMTYSAFALGTPYQVPLNSHVEDLGSLDARGMHPRLESNVIPEHNFEEFSKGDQKFCSTCERNSTGVAGLGILHTAKFAARKSKSIIGFHSMQPQK
jgi:hypothetical protein